MERVNKHKDLTDRGDKTDLTQLIGRQKTTDTEPWMTRKQTWTTNDDNSIMQNPKDQKTNYKRK